MEPIDPRNPGIDETPQTGEDGSTDLASSPVLNSLESSNGKPPSTEKRGRFRLRGKFQKIWPVLVLFTYLVGLGSGYILWGRPIPGRQSSQDQALHPDMKAMAAQINPKDGYEIPATFGNIGPKLLEAGAIDLTQFVKIYQEMGKPLNQEKMAILTEGSSARVVINPENQHFLLNLFWAFGLANQNPVLTDGPMMRDGKNGVVNFASTGGWTVAARPISELYAGSPIISLTEEQQKRLEEVAQGVYRPCCDNPTHFPDCNHGMAMLGLLELMASQDASTDAMFQAAKYVNAFWFPQQTLEIAIAFKTAKHQEFQQAEARQVVGQSMSSGSGFRAVHQWLIQNNLLEQAPQGGGGCGVK